MEEEFLKNLAQDAIRYPFGKPKDRQRRWEDLEEKEKEQWEKLAQRRLMQIYGLAHTAFELKTTKGIPEEISERFLQKKFNLSDEDIKNFRISLEHFTAYHKIQSRKSIKRFQWKS